MQELSHRLRQVLKARHPCILAESQDEETVRSSLVAITIEMGREVRTWSVAGGLRAGLFVEETDVAHDTEHPAAALRQVALADEAVVYCFHDLCGHLDEAVTLRALREAIARCRATRSTLFLIDHRDDWPAVLEHDAVRLIVPLPSVEDLDVAVREELRRLHQEERVAVELTKGHFREALAALRGLTRTQALRVVREVALADDRFDAADIEAIVAAKQDLLRGAGILEVVTPGMTLDQVGGFQRLKAWLELRQANAARLGEPRGILLLGVPGSGKSLAARAIAGGWPRPLLRLDAGRLYDKYVGESERRLRQALAQAEATAPVVVWIDEIEKGFASAAAQSTDGGLSQRMFGSLLTWMQERAGAVFVVATANDVTALPPELLRKGRFDEIFFVDLPHQTTRQEILAVHAQRRSCELPSDVLVNVAAATEGWSGAELEQVIAAALQAAVARGDSAPTQQDLITAAEESPPLSVTMAERVAGLREWAAGRAVPAD